MTLKQQIIDAYREAIEPREIADRFGCSVNYAAKVICVHRRDTGEDIEPSNRRARALPLHEGRAWDMPSHARRMSFHKRAVNAAHKARMATL